MSDDIMSDQNLPGRTPGASMHDQIRDEIVDQVLAQVSPSDRAAHDHHLAECADCSAFLTETEQTVGLLGAYGQVHQPPPGLRESILREARGEARAQARGEAIVAVEPAGASDDELTRARLAREDTKSGRSPSTLVTRLLAVAAVVLLAASVAWGVSLRGQRDSATAQVSSYAEAIQSLTQPGQMSVAEIEGSSGSAVATAFVRSTSAMVMPQSLSPNDRANSIYVLWSMTNPTDSSPVAIGSFDVTPDAKMSPVVSTGSSPTGTWFAISIEDGRRVPAAPSDVLGAGDSA